MPALIFHLLVGLLAGSLFRVQTLVVLAFAVLVEGVASFILVGAHAGLVWLVVGQAALQAGYLGGMYFRSILERIGIIVAAEPGRR